MKGCVIAGSATGESSEKASDGMSYDTEICSGIYWRQPTGRFQMGEQPVRFKYDHSYGTGEIVPGNTGRFAGRGTADFITPNRTQNQEISPGL